MSDTVQNPDIEDVLSSIRRLVSHEGGRKATNNNDAQTDAQDSQDQSSKLVLTPALRVENDETTDVSKPAAQDDTSDSEALDLMSPDVPLAFTSARAARQKAEGEDQALVLEDQIDEARAPAEKQTHTAETSVDATETLSPNIEESPEQGTTQEETTPAAHHAPTAHETLTAKIAALEEVIGREPDQWEPESEGLGENAGTDVDALPWEDHVDETNVQSEDDAPMADDALATKVISDEVVEDDGDSVSDPDLSDIEDTILDEDMLRDLVSSIVREELQGALGERITRNVRKLVRREIHRAMSAQDFN